MPWKFVLVNTDGSRLGELTQAKTRTCTWPIDAAATASFTIDGMLTQASMIQELQTDLVIYDPNGVKRFRGRLGPSGDQIDVNGHVCTFNAIDYRGALGRRLLWDFSTSTFAFVDVGSIPWTLISENEAIAGGAWGLTQGSGAITGVPGFYSFTAGSYLADLIDQMATASGFEWEIDPDLQLNIFCPQRGSVTSQVLEYNAASGGNLLAVNPRTLDTSTYSNALRFTGASTLSPEILLAPSFGPAGRWETQVGDTSILDQTTLAGQATAALNTDAAPQASYSLVLRNPPSDDSPDGWWDPSVLWLGDTALIVIKSGRLDVNNTDRITQAQVDLGDDGGNTVTLSTGIVPLDESKTTNHLLDRIVNLERT